MLISGPIKSGKTTFLIEQYLKIFKKEGSTSKILVICQNSYKKK